MSTKLQLSTTTRDDLINYYVNMMLSDNATIFAGAGLSIDSGMPSWNRLMEIPIKALGLKVRPDEDMDFYDIAEKYVLHHAGRTALTNLLVKEIAEYKSPSDNHRIITRLPLTRVWTTNFDKILEEAYKKSGKKYTPIRRDLDFTTGYTEDVKIYKIHGCISIPEGMVITKTDVQAYETNYEITSKAFQTALAEDTFLFIGFSFKDPHFETIMGILKNRYSENTRQHYAIIKKPEKKKEYNRYSLMIKLLLRYGILTLVVEDYSEISLLLKDIEKAYIRKNIFLSGSFDKKFHENYVKEPVTYSYEGREIYIPYDRNDLVAYNNLSKNDREVSELNHNLFYITYIRDKIKKKLAERFPYADENRVFDKLLDDIGERIFKKNMNIFTGFGQGVCDVIVEGFSKMFRNRNDYQSIMERLNIFPLPLKRKVDAFHNNFYRENLLGSCGFMLILRGGTYTSDYTSGTFEEYYIAKGLSDLLYGRQIQVNQTAQKILSATITTDQKKRKKIEKSINSTLKLQKKLILYQYQEIAEMFYRTLYEQWKLIIRLLDGYKRRGIIIIEKKICAAAQKPPIGAEEISTTSTINVVLSEWLKIRKMLRHFILQRTLIFYNLFETDPLTIEDSEININNDGIDKLLKSVVKVERLLDKAENEKQDSDDGEDFRKGKVICRSIIRLIQGDYKYHVIAGILEEFNENDIELMIKTTDLKNKDPETEDQKKDIDNELTGIYNKHNNNFHKFWQNLVLHYNACTEASKKSASKSGDKSDNLINKKEYILYGQFDYLFCDQGLNKWRDVFAQSGDHSISEPEKKNFAEYLFKIYYKYHYKKKKELEKNGFVFDPSGLNWSETLKSLHNDTQMENTGAQGRQSDIFEASYSLIEPVFYKLQVYKVLLVLSDVIGGLQRVKADFETINISAKTNKNDNLRNSIFDLQQTREFDQADERKKDPFFYDPNKFGDILAHHIDYIRHYSHHVHFLLNMLEYNIHLKNIRSIVECNNPNPDNEEDGKESRSFPPAATTSRLLENTIEQIQQHKEIWEKDKNKYVNIPFRPATVILPVASLGGMALKIWKEERIRFDYLCSYKKNFDSKTRKNLLFHFDNLFRVKIAPEIELRKTSAGEPIPKEKYEMQQQKEAADLDNFNKLLDSIFSIIDTFQKPPKVGAVKSV